MPDDQSTASFEIAGAEATGSEIAALAQRVATARGKLPLQHDAALLDVLSDKEIEAERELAEWLRAQRRKQRRRAVQDELAAEKRDRRTSASLRRTDEADARWHRRALAARRRVASQDARLATLYRRAEWSSRALIAVVVLGMIWAGVNVQHNLVPSGDMTDPLYWLSYGIEAMISIPIITIMVAATTAARWGRELQRGKVIFFETALLGTTIALNAGPHLTAGDFGRAAEYAIAPVMVGVVIWLHAWVSARYALLIEGAAVVEHNIGPTVATTHRIAAEHGSRLSSIDVDHELAGQRGYGDEVLRGLSGDPANHRSFGEPRISAQPTVNGHAPQSMPVPDRRHNGLAASKTNGAAPTSRRNGHASDAALNGHTMPSIHTSEPQHNGRPATGHVLQHIPTVEIPDPSNGQARRTDERRNGNRPSAAGPSHNGHAPQENSDDSDQEPEPAEYQLFDPVQDAPDLTAPTESLAETSPQSDRSGSVDSSTEAAPDSPQPAETASENGSGPTDSIRRTAQTIADTVAQTAYGAYHTVTRPKPGPQLVDTDLEQLVAADRVPHPAEAPDVAPATPTDDRTSESAADNDDVEIWAVARAISDGGLSALPVEQLAEILTLTDQSWTPTSIGTEVGLPRTAVAQVLESARKIQRPYAISG